MNVSRKHFNLHMTAPSIHHLGSFTVGTSLLPVKILMLHCQEHYTDQAYVHNELISAGAAEAELLHVGISVTFDGYRSRGIKWWGH